MPKTLSTPAAPTSRLERIRRLAKRPLDLDHGRPPRAHDRSSGRLFPPEPPAPADVSIDHPSCRGECQSGPRPCPLVGCLYNNYLDVREGGTIRLTYPDRLPEDVPKKESCALDVAESGPHTLDEVASILGLTRERIRQIEGKASKKILKCIEKRWHDLAQPVRKGKRRSPTK